MQYQMQAFKQQIESMFEESFQELNRKNQLNKNILSNLMDAATEQSQQINQMDQKLQSLNGLYKNQNETETNYIKKEVRRHQEMAHNSFDTMMYRLQQVEEGINQQREKVEKNNAESRQVEGKMDQMISKMEEIIAKEQIPEYKGDRETLMKEIDEFEGMLNAEMDRDKTLKENVDFAKQTLTEPMSTYETKMTLHNKANEQILKDKLSGFSDKIRKLEKKVEETTWMMNSEINKSNQEQKKIIEDLNGLENEMGRLRTDLQGTDERRRQSMQSHAATLDNMVEGMLAEAKKLEIRVETLRKGYEDENQKLRAQVGAQKMTL